MKQLALGLAFAALAAIWATIARADDSAKPPTQSCRLARMESLDVETLTSGEIAVPVSLNNRPYRMLVDTGSDRSSLAPDVAEQLGLEQKLTLFGGSFLNNVPVFTFVELDSIAFGRLHSRTKWPMLVAPDSVLSPTIAGLVGADVMANYDIEFDFFGGKMNFFAPTDCPDPVYWTTTDSQVPIELDKAGHVTVEAMLDGKPVKVFLDTGSPDSVMSLDAARDLFGWRDDDPRVVHERTLHLNGGASTPFYKYPFATLSFGGVTIQHPGVGLIPRANFNPHGPDRANIILGMSVIRQLHLFVAYRESRLFLTAAEPAP